MATRTTDTDADEDANANANVDEGGEARRLETVHVYRRVKDGEAAYEHVASVFPDRGISASAPDVADSLTEECERLLRDAADRIAETTAYSAAEVYETLRPTDVRADLIRSVAAGFEGGEYRTLLGGDDAPTLG